MSPVPRHHLAHLDRALLALLNERARLVQELGTDAAAGSARLSDLLGRNEGPLAAAALRAIFAAVDEGCRAHSTATEVEP